MLITGAASGIGKNTAWRAARAGMHVIASDRDEEGLAAVRKEAGQDGLSIDTVHLDVCSNDSIAASVQAVAKLTDGKGPDVLLNNAGYGELGPLDVITDAAARRQFDVNVFGLLAVTRAYLPRMQQRRAGRIINIASIAGHVAPAFWGIYAASKHAVEAISDSLRQECAPFDIQVSIVEPWLVKTKFSGTAFDTLYRHDFSATPWAKYFTPDRKASDLKLYDKMAVEPDAVSDAVLDAATSSNPRARYMVPRWAKLVVGLITGLPEKTGDWLGAKLGGMDLRKAISGS